MQGSEETTAGADGEEGLAVGFGSPVADRVNDLLAPVVATVDAELVDVQWTGGTLRVVADRPGGITTDGLAEINRLVSPILDQHDPVPGRYTLEVSSPGVERPLRRPDHFRRAIGETVVVKTVAGVEPRRVRGSLRSIDDAILHLSVVEIDGVELAEPEDRSVALTDIGSARTHFEWGPSPKPGKGKPGKGKPGKGKPGKGKPGKGTKSKSERKSTAEVEPERGNTKSGKPGSADPGRGKSAAKKRGDEPEQATTEEERGRP